MGGSSSKKPVAYDGTIPKVELSKQLLDFNLAGGSCPLEQPIYDEVELTNGGTKKMRFKFDPVCPASCAISFTPEQLTLDKGKSRKIKVKFVMLQKTNANFKVTIRVDGGPGVFVNVKVAGETGVFGVDPTTLEMAEDSGHRVPAILVNMKNCISKVNGFNSEGIFRLAGEQTEIKRIKELMNKKQFDFNSKDVNTIASLLKIWFRDLPVPILNALPQEQIMSCSDQTECIGMYQKLGEPQKTLLDWLMDLLVVISANSAVNKMTSQNLAIVIAPNLYDISTPNPMEGLILSQKCAQFLNHVLSAKINGLC